MTEGKKPDVKISNDSTTCRSLALGSRVRVRPLLSSVRGGGVPTEQWCGHRWPGVQNGRWANWRMPCFTHCTEALLSTFHAVSAKQQSPWKRVWAPAAEQRHTEGAPGGAARVPWPYPALSHHTLDCWGAQLSSARPASRKQRSSQPEAPATPPEPHQLNIHMLSEQVVGFCVVVILT